MKTKVTDKQKRISNLGNKLLSEFEDINLRVTNLILYSRLRKIKNNKDGK